LKAKRQAIAAFDLPEPDLGTERAADGEKAEQVIEMMVRPEGFEPPAY
jgi:hypothetical protein